jgi:hypothetical protein
VAMMEVHAAKAIKQWSSYIKACLYITTSNNQIISIITSIMNASSHLGFRVCSKKKSKL